MIEIIHIVGAGLLGVLFTFLLMITSRTKSLPAAPGYLFAIRVILSVAIFGAIADALTGGANWADMIIHLGTSAFVVWEIVFQYRILKVR